MDGSCWNPDAGLGRAVGAGMAPRADVLLICRARSLILAFASMIDDEVVDFERIKQRLTADFGALRARRTVGNNIVTVIRKKPIFVGESGI